MHKVLIIGSGRMGLRHASGALAVNAVDEVCLVDMSQDALNAARQHFLNAPNNHKLHYLTIEEATHSDRSDFTIAIIATTASDRLSSMKLGLKMGAKEFLIEKALGQSPEAVKELIDFAKQNTVYSAVNLNMRQYESFIKVKSDLLHKPQFQGNKVITINTGTIGIAANGIHYLDLLYYLFDAQRAELFAAEIEDTLIPSGRGPQFKDFGGWATIKYYNNADQYLGRAHLSMSSTSTVFGGWDIVASNGRITINEIEQKRLDYLRKEDSTAPVNRYAADYLPPVESAFESPFLGDLTQKWIEGLFENKKVLPPIEESLKVHELMFKWLSHAQGFNEEYPIT